MRKITISRSSVPMFDIRRDIYNIAGQHFYTFLTPFLIISSSGNTNQNLTATVFCFMNMPIVSAFRLKGYIKNTNLVFRNRSEETLSAEILCKVSFGSPIGNIIDEACFSIVLSSVSSFLSFHTSFAI